MSEIKASNISVTPPPTQYELPCCDCFTPLRSVRNDVVIIFFTHLLSLGLEPDLRNRKLRVLPMNSEQTYSIFQVGEVHLDGQGCPSHKILIF
ncbi:MAG: hypothetical protein KI793_24570 [Rivularia sp. (in: Bacteria)]|nr:hypothetical protein [Rivularia sp. MS3]